MFWELNLAVLSELHCPDQVGTERSPGGGLNQVFVLSSNAPGSKADASKIQKDS